MKASKDYNKKNIMQRKEVMIVGGQTSTLRTHRGSLIEHLTINGYAVHGVGVESDSITEAWIKERGGSLSCLPIVRTGVPGIQDIRYIYNLRKLMERVRPCSVISYTHKAVVYSGIAARLAGYRAKSNALITGLGYAFGTGKEFKRYCARASISNCYKLGRCGLARWIFQNTDDALIFEQERIIPRESPRIVVNGSGVDLAVFRVQKMVEGPLTVLFMSRMLADKGVRELVRAVQLLRAEGFNLVCRLVGPLDSNPTGINIQELAAWEQSGVVTYAGATNNVSEEYRNCSLFVLPTYYREGVPRVILEAMASGRPIITTDTPGCRETIRGPFETLSSDCIRGENGYLVQTKSVTAIATAIAELARRPKLLEEMGRMSRVIAEDVFDARKVNDQMLKFIKL